MSGFPYLKTNVENIDRAFRIALGDLAGNIIPYKGGLLNSPKEVVMAGMDYVTPWTRDAAINTWNGAGLLFPEVTLNTLLSVLEQVDGKTMIGGEYWDAIIWSTGAWWQYLYTGDKKFLKAAFEATKNSLGFFEQTELSEELNLFRGGSCYGDGVSAYPDMYTKTKGGSSGISDWPSENPELAAKKGAGVPTHVLSTNCLYYNAYKLLGKMAAELDYHIDAVWSEKADKLKEAINAYLWNEEKGHYNYLVDSFGSCDFQEGLGQSFAIIFGVADDDKCAKIFNNTKISEAGVPCLWPSFKRYDAPDGQSFGRHSGTVWPHIQGFWADAAKKYGCSNKFDFELTQLAKHACENAHFQEIYHPVTGRPYGGLQEWQGEIIEWKSCIRQTWSATAYLHMIIADLFGMDFHEKGISLSPCVTAQFGNISLKGVPYRNAVLDIEIVGVGTKVAEFKVNGAVCEDRCISCDIEGNTSIQMTMI